MTIDDIDMEIYYLSMENAFLKSWIGIMVDVSQVISIRSKKPTVVSLLRVA